MLNTHAIHWAVDAIGCRTNLLVDCGLRMWFKPQYTALYAFTTINAGTFSYMWCVTCCYVIWLHVANCTYCVINRCRSLNQSMPNQRGTPILGGNTWFFDQNQVPLMPSWGTRIIHDFWRKVNGSTKYFWNFLPPHHISRKMSTGFWIVEWSFLDYKSTPYYRDWWTDRWIL